MGKQHKAFVFRIEPNKEQRILMAKTFGCVRFVFNKMLEEKIEYYKDKKEMLQVTPAKYKEEYPWLKEVDSLALANAGLNLETAYNNFFRDSKVGFPKFKRKHDGHNTYITNLVNGNISLEDGYLKLPKLGKVKIKQHRQIPEGYILKSVTVTLKPSGRYYVSILYEYEEEIKEVEPVNVIGLDFSMKELYVDSNGECPSFPHPYRKSQEKLAIEQQRLSTKAKGSKNYQKQKRKVAKLHEHIANQRKDFLHKESRQITNVYDAVIIEDLDMRAMSKALNFGKSVGDNSWGAFTRMLDYKLKDNGKQLIKIDRWFPSSKTCSNCGAIKNDLQLSERIYRCECGLEIDRDLNAAINIKNVGIAYLNRGTRGE